MREIKFRAWNGKKKEWLFGYELPNLGGFSLFGEIMMLGEWSSTLNVFLFSRNGYTPDDLKVTQFTGLKDKNGKEIYEGDILSKSYGQLEPLILGKRTPDYEVQFRLGHFICVSMKPVGNPDYLSTLADSHEVISNIYENPELLSERSKSN